MDFIDIKYINLISSRLQKFKKVKPHLYNFRCPICGDSQKNKNKARGYLYRIKNNTNYKCHNCGINMSFNNFLKDIDPQTHKEYTLEKFKEGHTGKNFTTESPEDVFKNLKSSKPTFKEKVKIDLPSAFTVDRSRLYLESRAIFNGDFYYCEDFNEFTGNKSNYKDPRIVIPLIKDGVLIGYQGRALDKNPVKYLTTMLEDNQPKIYGYDKLNKELPVYVVEGPFDSTFLNNSVALCGSDGDVSCLEGSSIIFVYDNEPRNKEIVARISRVIERGGRVVIWPGNIREKDLNDMVLMGHDVEKVVKEHTFSGLEAKLKFNHWKKV